jgi:hypothetical protein
MSFLADDSFHDLYERIKQTADTQILDMTAYSPRMDLGGEAMPLGIPLTPGGMTRSMFDPLRLSNRLATAAAADPVVSELQQIF